MTHSHICIVVLKLCVIISLLFLMATMYEPVADKPFHREDVSQMKRKLNLDLSGNRPLKKVRVSNPNINALLTSPDLNMLKVSSPELDALVLKQSGILPSGPGFIFTHNYVNVNKVPTPENPDDFVKGFEDTLDQFHKKDSSVIVTLSGPAPQYTQLECVQKEDISDLQIKEEPQTVPSVCGSPPMSPVNMEAQERIKLERKRLRNRIAATKCRRRKLERINKLEVKVGNLKNENTELQGYLNRLKDTVCYLKQQVMEHVSAGCPIPFHV